MKPTLKSKTEELLKKVENELSEQEVILGDLKIDQESERKKTKELVTLGKISIDKQIAEATATRQAIRVFIVELNGLLNWA